MGVHQLKVTLLGVRPPVWRRVHLDSGSTLADLHEVLQAAMGWGNCHLHSFDTGWGACYGDGPEARAETPTLAEVLPHVGGRLGYVYDFGDYWEHIVEVQKIHRPGSAARYPRCSTGGGACPPEDCGGPPGYEDMQRALRARKGWRYHEAREFLGCSRWDPAAFDLAEANAALAALAPEPNPAPATTRVTDAGTGTGDTGEDAAADTAADQGPAGRQECLARLGTAHTRHCAAEAELGRAARAALAAGASYADIGRTLGITRQAARKRWPAPPPA